RAAPAGSTGGSGGHRDGGACPIMTEGCPCSGMSCNAGLACRAATCAKVVCGDHHVEGDEVCDDGHKPGAALGDCAPDCSKRVDEKRIVASRVGVHADFAKNGVASLITLADSYCPTGFKALFSAAGRRVASTTPFSGSGQVDWALKPWT